MYGVIALSGLAILLSGGAFLISIMLVNESRERDRKEAVRTIAEVPRGADEHSPASSEAGKLARELLVPESSDPDSSQKATDKNKIALRPHINSTREFLGWWQSTDHIVRGDVKISRRPPYQAKWSYDDGSKRTVDLVETSSSLGRRFNERGSRSGDHYVITAGGELQVRDEEGLAFTCTSKKLLPSANPIAQLAGEQQVANERVKQVSFKVDEQIKRRDSILSRAREILGDLRVSEKNVKEWYSLSEGESLVANKRRNNPSALTLADAQILKACNDQRNEFLDATVKHLAELTETRMAGYRSMTVGMTTSDSARKAFPNADITRTLDLDSEPEVILYKIQWKDFATVFLRFETKHPKGGLFYLVKKSQVNLESSAPPVNADVAPQSEPWTPQRKAWAIRHFKSRGVKLKTNNEGDVVEINMNGVQILDSRDYVPFGQFPHCRKLNLKNCEGVSSAVVVFIGQMKNLRELDLSYTAVSDIDLIALESLNHLNMLSLWETSISGDGLKYIHSLKQLRSLYLPRSTSQVSNDSVQALLRKLPKCQVYR